MDFERIGDILSVAIPTIAGGLIWWMIGSPEASKFLFSFLIANGLTHLIKALTFAPRPHTGEGEWVKWKISINSGDSFPSGHTTSAMSGAFYSILVLNPYVGLLLFGSGFLVALSRVHAKAHFYRDVFWGMMIATLTSLVIHHNLFGTSGWLLKLF